MLFLLPCYKLTSIGVASHAPPGSQASPRGEAKDSALLPSRDADILEPPSGVSGVKPPLHFGERARTCLHIHKKMVLMNSETTDF